MTECEHNRACRMAYGDEGCKPPCDLGFPCHLYERKVDREALLALADEIEAGFQLECSTGPAHMVVELVNIEMGKLARRIRKALGVSDG